MQPLEAMTLLVQAGDELKRFITEDEDGEFSTRLELAQSIITAMLNTALPIARFRCFVQVTHHGDQKDEFTICGVRIEDIRAGLIPVNSHKLDVYVQLWEQRKNGAEMLSGYQGHTKGHRYRDWLKSLDFYQDRESVKAN